MYITIGSDHAGYQLKTTIINYLKGQKHEIYDVGAYSDQSVDYPDFAHPVAQAVDGGKTPIGILICGSGNGVCMTANKYKEVRAALCWTKELASLARQHNNANILCIPARFVSARMAISMIKVFLSTEFEGGRHMNRINKIAL